MAYAFVDSEEELGILIAFAMGYDKPIGADIESTGLDWMLDKILLLQLNFGGQIYIVDVRNLGYSNLTKLMEVLQFKELVFHNAKFDMRFLAYATKILPKVVYDTMTAEIILNAGKGNKYYSLSDVVEKYTDYFTDKTVRSDFINFPDDKPFTEAMIQYSAMDVLPLLEVYQAQWEEFNKTFQDKVARLEMELLPVVAKMEMDGIRLDVQAWLEVEKRAIEIRDELTRQLSEMVADFVVTLKVDNGLALAEILKIPVTGKARRAALEGITDTTFLRSWVIEHFNAKSPQQMKTIFHLMGIKVKDTNAKTLEDWRGNNPIVNLLLDIREVNKQIDSYGTNVVELIHPVTGKIHTEYSTVGTQTGRFSSNKPNMQNIPTHGGYRECFLPDPGYVFVGIDYSQQEYRLAGAVSGDRRIIDAYKNGSDMHTATAQVVYKKTDVTKDERNRGKTVNFAILYGSTEFGLKNNLNISEDEAKIIIDDFWKGYPQLDEFMKQAGNRILELGFSSTPLGRRRYNVPKPMFMNTYEFNRWQARILREGKNHIIQGGGADILKLAMVRIFKENPYGELLRPCLQIHDELVVQIHESVKEEGALFVKGIMEDEEQNFLGEIPAKVDGWDNFKDRWSK